MGAPGAPASGGGPPLDAKRFARAVAAHNDAGDDPGTSLCGACVDVLGLSGVGIMLASGSRLDCVAASDAQTGDLEALELMIGEGPCLEAFRNRTTCSDDDLGDNREVAWRAFRERALAVGVRAAYGFPVVVADVCIGVLNCHNTRAGVLSAEQVADALVVADISGKTILAWKTGAPVGTLAWQLQPRGGHRVVVHQAAGRVSVQAGVAVGDALTLMGAHAFARDRTILDVADDVLTGELRFDG